LRPYRSARARVQPLGEELRRAVKARSPDQLPLANEIAALAEAKFDEIDATVAELAMGDRDGAQRRILTDEGQNLMERLRSRIERLSAVESDRLDVLRQSSVENENRIVPLLTALLALILAALALGLSQVLRAARTEASEAQAEQLRVARDRADLLASELNHRVKNLFAVVLAIVRMSGRENPDARAAIDQVAGRIDALTKAHAVTQGSPHHRVAQLGQLVETALAPYRTSGSTCQIDGPLVDLPENAVVPVGLVLHELATNAVKYGAWSSPGGHIVVGWTCGNGKDLHLTWREHGAKGIVAPGPGKEGFGSALVEGAARQLSGKFERQFHDDGMEQHLAFPLTR
jgi:two-component sensor histidine kinase